MESMRSWASEITNSVRSLVRVFRLKPWDTSTAEGRSQERYRRAMLTTTSAVISKFISMLTLLVSVPLTMNYLGAERYGIWLTITSTIAILGFADLGIGSGLVTTLADATGRADYDSARVTIASAFWMLSSIAVVIFLGMAWAYPVVNWAAIFNVHSPSAMRETGPALVVVLACFALNLPLGVVARIESSLQRGYMQNLWAIAGSLSSLAGLLIAVAMRAGLPVLLLLVSLAPVISSLGNWLQLAMKHSWVRPNIAYCALSPMFGLLQTGLFFFVVQVSMAVAYQADNLIIARFMGAGAVPSYAVPARLFSIALIVVAVLMGPLWPAYADANGRGDRDWMRRAFRRSVSASLAIALPTICAMVVFGNLALRLWVGPQVHAPISLLVLFGIRCLMSSYLSPALTLLNGVGEIRFQAVIAASMALANIVLSVALVMRIGVIGAIAGTVVSEAIFLIVPTALRVRQVLRGNCCEEVPTCAKA